MFTKKQIKELLKNKNVDKCSPKSITYNNKFKLLAIKKYYEDGYSPSMIFEEAGFDIIEIGKERIRDCLKRWRKKYNREGKAGLMKQKRGRPRKEKVKFKDKNEEIKYLKLKIKYLDAQNDFLAKLRGLKRE
ncbi:MAG: helix-turn-helix domain-containing protein [Parcubacteria group bacterium]|nr:helix-turn-helix domain-containing protein [Parcubacteria group bacterium]